MDQEQYKENSKKRLLNNIKKKFDTTIIGSLAAFEEEFGYLWGHGKHYSELTDQEVRSKILDNGNFNLRSAQSEISQYTLSWNRYVTKFNFRNQGE
jgi:hypothetical protein